MSSSRCSRLLLVTVALALVLSAGVVGAVSVSDSRSPDEAEVGATIEASYTLTELYREPSYEQWTLRTETALENVTWTFELVDQAGNVVETNSVDGQNASQALSIDDGVAEVTVEVTGTVPAVQNYSYDPAETFLVAELRHTREGGTSSTIEAEEAHHYTAESRDARDAIEAAEEAIDSAGGSAQAEESLSSAISAYEGENFENAVTLAERAEAEANQARQTSQRNQLIVYAVVAIVVVAVIAGGIYWYLANRRTSRL